MTTPGSTDDNRDLVERAERIAALRAAFAEKMQALRTRQRKLLEKVFARLDKEKAEQVRKSLDDIKR